MNEASLQNHIRNALVDRGMFFRANVGQGWTGSDIRKLPDGSIIIGKPRPLKTGLPRGFSDLFGLVPITITEEHVGKKLAVFCAVEVKTPTGRLSKQQGAFLRAVEERGGLAYVARDVDGLLSYLDDHT